MRLLLLDNRDSFTFNLVQILKEAGVENLSVCPVDEFRGCQLENFDRYIISPGPDVPSAYPEISQLIDFAIISGKPLLGVCLGHQSIAVKFGGELLQPVQIAHGIRSELLIKGEHPSLFRDLTHPIMVGRYHSWAVNPMKYGHDLIVTSTLADGMVMSLKHAILPIEGVQFHPESIMTDQGEKMLKNWLSYPFSNNK